MSLQDDAEELARKAFKANGHGTIATENEPKYFDPINLQGVPVPVRRWLVPDWIPFQTVTGLYGDGGVGKSLLAQQLLTATALNQKWIGLQTMPVKSLGVFCEDPHDELHMRQYNINLHYDCEFADLADMRWLERFGEDNVLMDFNGGHGNTTKFFDEVLVTAKEFGAQLVIIDTVADTFGGNENDRNQVRQFIQVALGQIAREIDGCVVALAHPSRSGLASGSGDSGSTGWNNSFRSRAFLSEPEVAQGEVPDPNARTLQRKKANYALRDDTIDLRWNNGVLIPIAADTGIIASINRRSAERVFLDLLAALTAENRHVSESKHSGNFAPRVFANRPDREKYKQEDFHGAMERLFAQRRIIVEEYGRAHDRRTRIAAVRTNDPLPE
jgi:RecA-family ATPase